MNEALKKGSFRKQFNDKRTLIRKRDFYLLPNILTISRVFAIPLVMGLLFYGHNWWSAIVFGITGISDYVDGWIARRYQYESKLGMLLDPLADKIIIISTMIMLLWIGRLDFGVFGWDAKMIPPILVIVTVGREMAITGLRAIASTVGITIPADRTGKIKTWIQFFAIAFLLSGAEHLTAIGLLLLCVSVFAALLSGIQYVIRFVKRLPG